MFQESILKTVSWGTGIKKSRKYVDKLTRPEVRPDLFIGFVLVVSTIAVYWQVWNYEFIGYDDNKYVAENHYVRQGITSESVIWAFTSTHASNWHPITWLSHMLDVELYGMNAGFHHLTNLLFHIFNSLLVFIVFRKMTTCVWQSGVLAILFSIHPLHVESVAWVAERKDVISTFFGMLTLWSYARYSQDRNITRYLTVVGFFILSLMAKPMLVSLPFVLLLLDYWPLNRIQGWQAAGSIGKANTELPLWRLVYEKIPLFVLAGASSTVTFLAQKKGEAVALLDTHPLMMRLANALISYVKYLQKLVWPHDLAILYPYPDTVIAWQVFGACALLGGITLFAIRCRKRFPWLFVGWFWYVGTLVPVIGLVQVGVQAIADRYSYIPLIGVFIILAWGIIELFANRPYKRMALSAVAAAAFLVLLTASRAQVSYWENSIRLFEHTLEVTEGNYVIHNNLGFELALQGQKDKAIEHYKEALRINPDFELAHINLGSALFSQGKKAESFAYYQKVLKARPDLVNVRHNYGILLLRVGETDAAVAQFREALRLKPTYAEVYNSLGAALISQGKIQEAMANFRQAIRIKSDLVEAKTNLKNLSAAYERNANQKIKIDFQ